MLNKTQIRNIPGLAIVNILTATISPFSGFRSFRFLNTTKSYVKIKVTTSLPVNNPPPNQVVEFAVRCPLNDLSSWKINFGALAAKQKQACETQLKDFMWPILDEMPDSVEWVLGLLLVRGLNRSADLFNFMQKRAKFYDLTQLEFHLESIEPITILCHQTGLDERGDFEQTTRAIFSFDGRFKSNWFGAQGSKLEAPTIEQRRCVNQVFEDLWSAANTRHQKNLPVRDWQTPPKTPEDRPHCTITPKPTSPYA